jgi:3-deoxy-manno-octulosonate cytidylyltransferase (CMP-KDO synthetase)
MLRLRKITRVPAVLWDNEILFSACVKNMKSHHRIVGVIPARLDSQRLPAKVLRPIGDKAMVHWVYERARQSPLLNELLIATDSEKVRQYCVEHAIPAVKTRQHSSGTDRLHEVMERTDGDIYVNIQGDEPTIRPDHIELLLHPIIAKQVEVATLKVAIDTGTAQDPNVVKVVTDNRGRALYFSRFPIPFDRDAQGRNCFYKHIGLYGYTRSALKLFHSLPQSPLELTEKLEQLRFLENGISIMVSETPHDTVGVDTEADLERAAILLTTKV